jgi:hypothetical protein
LSNFLGVIVPQKSLNAKKLLNDRGNVWFAPGAGEPRANRRRASPNSPR